MTRTIWRGQAAAQGSHRSSARPDTAYVLLWSAATATAFFLLSHPLALIFDFRTSRTSATVVVAVAGVISLPRMRVPSLPTAGFLLLLWGGLSYWWSISPGSTSSWFITFAAVAALAAVTAASSPARGVSVGVVLGAVMLSLASLWQTRDHLPIIDYTLSELQYLDGVGTHRNILSYTMVFGFSALVALRPRTMLGRVAFGAAAVVIVGTTLLTRSSTGLVAIAVLVVASLWMDFGHRAVRAMTMRRILPGLLAVAVLSLLFWRDLVAAVGRDASLSSRVPLWRETLAVALDRPLTGWGAGAVWPHAWLTPPYNPVIDSIQHQIGFPASHGHNSFIDATPELGLVGVCLAIWLYAGASLRAWVVLRASESAADRRDALAPRLVLLLVTALLLCGITEPVLATPLGWFLSMLVGSLILRDDHQSSSNVTSTSAESTEDAAHPVT